MFIQIATIVIVRVGGKIDRNLTPTKILQFSLQYAAPR
jgi:hypothetical protein